MKVFFENRTIKIVAETEVEKFIIENAIEGYSDMCDEDVDEFGLIEFSHERNKIRRQLAAIEASAIHIPVKV